MSRYPAQPGLGLRLAVLGGALLIGFTVLLPVAYQCGGGADVAAAGVAVAVCWLCGSSAAVVSQVLRRDPRLTMYEVLSGAMFRMAIPLALCMLVYRQGGWLVRGHFVYYLLAFYLLMLLAEIITLVRMPRGWQTPRTT